MRFRYALLPSILSLAMLVCTAVVKADTAAPPATKPSGPEPTDVATPKVGEYAASFMMMHEKFMKRKTEGPIDLLFLGDSITAGWLGPGKAVWTKNYADLNVANFGIGGDRTEHVLWRIDNGELDGIHPKVLILLIGTNNIGWPAEEILKGDLKIVQEIHEKLPDTKLLLMGIFPRGRDPMTPDVAAMREKIKTVNQGLAALDDGNKTRFLDISDKFLDADGKIPADVMPDKPALHPNAKGYQIWADAMAPLLTDMMK